MSRNFGVSNPAVISVSQASNLIRPGTGPVAPVAAGQSISTLEDAAVNIVLTASDANGDSLTYVVVDGPSNGGLTGTAPNLIYTPNANYNGSDSFTFKANDGTADSAVATVSITVTAVNDGPVASAQTVAVAHNTATAITLAGSDVDGDALTYEVVTNPANGSLTGTAPNLTYTPSSGYSGSDSFTFKVNDGTADSAAATVTLSVAAATDPSFASVSLLLKADGANGSTTFADSSANSFAISRTGNTVISTAQSKFGGSSAYFDGNGDYLSVSSSANLEFGSGNYTIEMWINPAGGIANNTQKYLFGKRQSLSIYGGVIGFLQFNSTLNAYRAYYYATVNGINWAISAATGYIIPANTWTHLAFVRNGNTFTVFVNGNSAASGVASGTIPSNSQPFVIGSTSAADPGVNGYAGYIDDLRVTKGIARYAANFTPPDSLPTSGT